MKSFESLDQVISHLQNTGRMSGKNASLYRSLYYAGGGSIVSSHLREHYGMILNHEDQVYQIN